eukprot:gene11845-5175_t
MAGKKKNKKRICKFYGTKNGCSNGKDCTFLHVHKSQTGLNKQEIKKNETKQEMVQIKEKIIKFDQKAFKKLIENFEFEYIFTFLSLEQIVTSTRVSKLFYESLTNNDLWEDLGKIEFQENFKKNAYKQVTELMKCSSLYLMQFDFELSIFMPVNIPFFNDKQIKKVIVNIRKLYVLTRDGILYQTSVDNSDDLKHDLTINDKKIFQKCCTKCGEIVDFDVPQREYNHYSYKYIGDSGMLVNKEGKVFDVKSFRKSVVTEMDSSWTENEPIEKVVSKSSDSFLISKNGVGFYNTKEETCRIKKPVKYICRSGIIDIDNVYFTHNDLFAIYNEKGKSYELSNVKMVKFSNNDGHRTEIIQKENDSIFRGGKNISHGLPEKVKDIFVGNSICYFKTVKNHYFSTNRFDHDCYMDPYGMKKHYQLISSTDKPKHNELEIFNDFPMEIKDIFDVDCCIIQGKKPYSKIIQQKLEVLKKKYLKEKEDLESQVLNCKRCFKKYFEFENKDDSCRYHKTNKTHEVKIWTDTTADAFDCCGAIDDTFCQSGKHIQ